MGSETATSNSSASKFLGNPRQDLQTRLNIVTRESRHAEALHAYDIGVMATLGSMKAHWENMGNDKYTSLSEKRIFRREAERLGMLLVDARGESAKSDKVLEAKLAEQDGLAEYLERADARILENPRDTPEHLAKGVEPHGSSFRREAGMDRLERLLVDTRVETAKSDKVLGPKVAEQVRLAEYLEGTHLEDAKLRKTARGTPGYLAEGVAPHCFSFGRVTAGLVLRRPDRGNGGVRYPRQEDARSRNSV